MNNGTRSVMVAASLMAIAAGCKGGSTLKTVPVTAKVTYNGEPLEGASVSFLQEGQAGAKTFSAFGKTDAQGVCKLTTMESPAKMIEGVVPGSYMVTVTKLNVTSGPAAKMAEKMSQTNPQELSQEEQRALGSQREGVPAGDVRDTSAAAKSLQAEDKVPDKYASPKESGLVAEVKDSGPQTFEFALKDE